MNLKEHIRSIQDYPKKGILFRDITTLIKNSEAFNHSIDFVCSEHISQEFFNVYTLHFVHFLN